MTGGVVLYTRMTPPQSKQARLTPRQERFKDIYLIELNATRAYMEAYKVKSEKVAASAGARLLANVKVAAAIQRAKEALADEVKVQAKDVLRLIWDTATADPRELIEYRRGCCRHCHGAEFEYQRTLNENRRALASWQKDLDRWSDLPKSKQETGKAPVFDAMGGIGFNATKPPHPECPECFGEGVERPYIHDTRKLSRAALSLYAGVKVTKDGIEVKVHDQQAARQLVGKHLGLFKEFEDPPGSEEERVRRMRAQLKAMDDATLGMAA